MNAFKSFTLTVLIVLIILAITVGISYYPVIFLWTFLSTFAFLVIWTLIHGILYG